MQQSYTNQLIKCTGVCLKPLFGISLLYSTLLNRGLFWLWVAMIIGNKKIFFRRRMLCVCWGDTESTEIDRISVLPCCVHFRNRHSDQYTHIQGDLTDDLVQGDLTDDLVWCRLIQVGALKGQGMARCRNYLKETIITFIGCKNTMK